MKTILNNREVPHAWAHQTQPAARGNGSISFNGPSLFSYAAEIARLVPLKGKGDVVALFADRTWTVTTSKHQSYARGAVRHLRSFRVKDLDAKPGGNFKHYRDKFQAALMLAANKRGARRALDEAAHIMDEANRFAETFGLRSRLTLSAKIQEQAAKAAEAERVRKAKKLASERRADAAHFAEWQAGTRSQCPRSYATPVRLRVIGDRVESSLGAQCPILHAKRAWATIKRCASLRHAFIPNGEQIELGTFTVDRIETDGTLVAGCHTVAYAEAHALAVRMGWESAS